MYEKLHQLYRGVCVFVSIVLTGWCVYEYLVDPEVSSIHLRKFHARPDDIHPSITLCDKNLFSMYSGNKLDDYQDLIGGNAKKYHSNFSQKYIQELNKIDYDNYLFSQRLDEQLNGQRQLAGHINTLENFRAGHEELADWMFSNQLLKA